jgi:antitoxin Phd
MGEPVWSLQDATNSFSVVVDAASKGTPQTVTKRGKPAVVVLSVIEYEREHLLAMPKDEGDFERIEIEPRDLEF